MLTLTHGIHRILLYALFKTLFLLYLALPQTQGALYQPFFHLHELEIDMGLAQLKAHAR